MLGSKELFEEFVMRRCEEDLSGNREYAGLRYRSVEVFNALNAKLDENGKDLLEEYESAVSHINDLIFSSLCKNVKGSCV